MPLKGIIVNTTKYTDFLDRSQTSSYLNGSGQSCAPRKSLPTADGEGKKFPSRATGWEMHHG